MRPPLVFGGGAASLQRLDLRYERSIRGPFPTTTCLNTCKDIIHSATCIELSDEILEECVVMLCGVPHAVAQSIAICPPLLLGGIVASLKRLDLRHEITICLSICKSIIPTTCLELSDETLEECLVVPRWVLHTLAMGLAICPPLFLGGSAAFLHRLDPIHKHVTRVGSPGSLESPHVEHVCKVAKSRCKRRIKKNAADPRF
mmetsp:Transcript_150266/g.265196  ORF Transcript_150266/g.265196 Transcript_150266/m.265196 type:complete len:202 (-) Transcript_150266:12-617(-)